MENQGPKKLKIRRILRDNIEGITKGRIKELARKAGVKTISRPIYDEVKGTIKNMLNNWIYNIITYTEHSKKRTVGIKEVSAGIPHKYYSKLLIDKKCKKRKSKKSSPEKDIAHYQKLGGCLTIGKETFGRLVREVAQDYKLDVRFSAEAIIMIQHCLENCVVEMLSKANLSATHAGRVRLFPKDLQFTINMTENTSKCGPGSLSAGAPSVNFEIYIKRLLIELYPGQRISKNALYQLNQLTNLLGKAIVEKAHFLNSKELQNRTKKTISSREIQSAVRLIVPGDLAKKAVSNGVKAVLKFNTPVSETIVKKMTMQEKAGLKFSVSRASKFFKKYNTRIGQGAPVYLASVLEYIIAEILYLSRDVMKNEKVTVSSRNLKLAIDNDEELKRLCKNLCFDIADGGVVPKLSQEE